jgi:hypothetical protein
MDAWLIWGLLVEIGVAGIVLFTGVSMEDCVG